MVDQIQGASSTPRGGTLGQTDNPRALIPGDPGQIHAYARALHDHGASHAMTATALRGMPVTQHWMGAAADAYLTAAAARVKRRDATAEATALAARAIEDYAEALTWAQRQATEAIALHDHTTESGRDRTSTAADSEGQRAEARDLLDGTRAQLTTLADDVRERLSRAHDALPNPTPTPASDGTHPHTAPASLTAVAPATTQVTSERTITVRRGDTLSGLAQRHLGDASRWPEIAELNPNIADPDLIFPGQRLRLPERADKGHDQHRHRPRDNDRHDNGDRCDPPHEDRRDDDDMRGVPDDRPPSDHAPRDPAPPSHEPAPERTEAPPPPATPPLTPPPPTPRETPAPPPPPPERSPSPTPAPTPDPSILA
jgi:nucleoid-associated protein YgaU